MMRLPLFATLTGLHLAVLQFCYFFLLLINVTSTYVTYMAVVIAWMLGTVLGLWLPLSVPASLATGVLAYYAVQWRVVTDPLGSGVLWISTLGVLVTGLWAGRFFVVLQPHFGRADKLFFHENNGFMLGVVGVFVGFTLLGKAFLLWAPLVSLGVLLVFWTWLHGHMPQPEPVLFSQEGQVYPADDASRAVPRSRARWLPELFLSGAKGLQNFGRLMVGLNLLVPAGIFVYAVIIDVGYWHLFWGEDNLITWFSTLQLMLVAAVAWLNAETAILARRLHGSKAARPPWIWWVMTVGFVFLSLDEQFRIHEQLRDDLLVPNGLFTHINWIRPGDVVFYFYFLVALVLARYLWLELERFRAAWWWFGSALVLAAVVIVIDALPESIVAHWPAPRFWTSAWEEIGENLTELLFLLAFLRVLTGRLQWLARKVETTGAEEVHHG